MLKELKFIIRFAVIYLALLGAAALAAALGLLDPDDATPRRANYAYPALIDAQLDHPGLERRA